MILRPPPRACSRDAGRHSQVADAAEKEWDVKRLAASLEVTGGTIPTPSRTAATS
jgi:hypothetical protein